MRKPCRRCKTPVQPIYEKNYESPVVMYYVTCINCTPYLIDGVEFFTATEQGYDSLGNYHNDRDISVFYFIN
jgi:hypothetical protein